MVLPGRPLPSVKSADPRLALINPRWGAGISTLEFEALFTGSAPSADCDYTQLDAAGAPAGMTGSLSVRANERSTQSILVSDNVTVIRVGVCQ